MWPIEGIELMTSIPVTSAFMGKVLHLITIQPLIYRGSLTFWVDADYHG